MNINNDVWEAAKARGLTWIATGGGCDFINRVYDGFDLILASQADSGTSPDELSEPSTVSVYTPESDWLTGIIFKFSSAVEAMDFMIKSPDFAMYDDSCKCERSSLVRFLDVNKVTEKEEKIIRACVEDIKAVRKKEFAVRWQKTYYASGEEKIEACCKEEAEEIMADQIGDFEGSLDYDADKDFIEVV